MKKTIFNSTLVLIIIATLYSCGKVPPSVGAPIIREATKEVKKLWGDEPTTRIEISKDGGRIWRLRYEGMMYGEFIDLNDAGTEIIATTTKGVYASKNEGMVWLKRS